MKKIKIIILLILITLTQSVKASTNTTDRQGLNNLGVNKHWNITENNKSNVLNTYSVDASEKIYDFSEKITDEEEQTIYNKLNEFIKHTDMDIAFVTVNLPYYSDKQNEDYAADFYDYNDFGIDKENYSGILLLRNTYESDPYYDMYTFGNAQLYFNKNRYDDILDSIYDDLHTGRYVEGLNTFVDKLIYYYDQGIPDEMQSYIVDKDGYLKKTYQVPWLASIIIASIITLIVILILVKKNKMVKSRLDLVDYIDPCDLHIVRVENKLINTYVTHYTTSSSSYSGGGGGFSSHSGSSGGGHSSGGGRHG